MKLSEKKNPKKTQIDKSWSAVSFSKFFFFFFYEFLIQRKIVTRNNGSDLETWYSDGFYVCSLKSLQCMVITHR